MRFDIIAAFDWSTEKNKPNRKKKKRWGCIARRKADTWQVDAPHPADDVVVTLRQCAAEGPVLAGFDFPLGLPSEYARKIGVAAFRDHLAAIPTGWDQVCVTADEISLSRPFYPAGDAPRGVHKPQHIFDALCLTRQELSRRCEKGAEIMFWTKYGKQVGKAMFAGWKEVILPLHQEAHLWPFDGDLRASNRAITIAEIYPARFYKPLMNWKGKKRCQQDRARHAAAILAHAERHGLSLDAAGLREGYPVGEDDAFDALIGALGMIEVIEGRRPEHPGLTPEVRAIEGWMLGG